jgi:5-methyltetrahydrofolate--homocysteine methyltransferase
VQERLSHALVHGITDLHRRGHRGSWRQALPSAGGRPLHVIEGPLMAGMNVVGDLFGAGKMFLPQVVKSRARDEAGGGHLLPYIEAEKQAASRRRRREAQGQDRHRHGQGRRARHRQEHRHRRAPVQQLRGRQHGRHGALPGHPGARRDREGADIIGLSGLITPSLEEMQHVAAEMQRDEFRQRRTPLLIGGATTSRVHTAVKIAPHYEGPVVYVPDASRSVGVCSELLSEERAAAYIAEVQADTQRVRELHAGRKATPLVACPRRAPQDARRLGRPCPAGAPLHRPPGAAQVGPGGTRGLHRLGTLLPDLGPGRPLPRDPARRGGRCRGAARVRRRPRLLQRAIDGRWLQASGVFALLPANTVDDDTIEVYTDASRRQVALRWNPLRLQTERPVVDGVRRPNRCLADFVAPRGVAADYIGLFAVTAGLGVERKEREFTAAHDDYSAIMLKALADRLAEAFAERLHQRVRTEFWGYAADEALTTEQLIAEAYRGIRPAPGYPACPDHGVKRAMFELLQAGEIGMGLTESLAMTPAASVCGFYLAHPEARYFNVGRIGEDQLGPARRGSDWAGLSGTRSVA